MPKQRVTDTSARLFIGLPIPDAAKHTIRQSMKSFRDHIERYTDEVDWHVTLVFLGEVDEYEPYITALIKPLPRTFVPTVSFTHLGYGRQHHQLWAYVHRTAALDALKQDIENRLLTAGHSGWKQYQKSHFVPHVRVATLKREESDGPRLPDVLSSRLFTATQAHVYRSWPREQVSAARGAAASRYETVGTIALTS